MTMALQEAEVLESLQHDIEFPCVVQWEMLWFSAPTSLKNVWSNDGEILEFLHGATNCVSSFSF